MERAIDLISLSSEDITNMCQKCFGRKGALQHFRPLTGGAVNTTFKVLFGNETLFLKIYVRDPHLAEVENQIYHLVKNSVPVPELLYSDVHHEPYPFALFRFFEGMLLSELSHLPSSSLSFELGAILGKIHTFQFPHAGLFGKKLSIDVPFSENSRPYFTYCIDHLSPDLLAWKRLGNQRARGLQALIRQHEKLFPQIKKGGVLVHSDFKPVNLLWNEKTGFCVTDWEFAHAGIGLMDFAILLRHQQDFPCDVSELERGYTSQKKKLPVDWVKRAHLVDLINIIQLLNMPGERPKLFGQLTTQIDRLLYP